MAPRFIEVSRPVEDGVAWATTLTDDIGTQLANMTTNAAAEVLTRLRSIAVYFAPNFNVYENCRPWLDATASALPSAKQETKYMVLASAGCLLLWWLFVMLRSRTILLNYGATKMMHKEA